MTKELKLITLFLVLTSTFTHSQIDELSIIEGKWKLDSDNFTLIEEWTKKSDIVFEGVSFLIENGEKNISERLFILKLHNHVVYIAQPEKSLPTLFTLVSADNNKFIFENKEHDFPQKIIYHFASSNLLNASIEGEIKGKMNKKEFRFNKLADN